MCWVGLVYPWTILVLIWFNKWIWMDNEWNVHSLWRHRNLHEFWGWLKMLDVKMTDHQNCRAWNWRTWNDGPICRTQNLHPDPIWNSGGLGFLWRASRQQQEERQHNKMSSDMRSLTGPDSLTLANDPFIVQRLQLGTLPPAVINCDTLSVLKYGLKTHLFNTAYSI